MATQGQHTFAIALNSVTPPTVGMITTIENNQLVKNRPLNSWMAYRSFYVRLFKGVQQKHASTLLHALWHEDPFKAKWAVVAKTYTVIKDKVGKDHAPLLKFLTLACPIMGIIDVKDYFEMLKWGVVFTEGNLHVIRLGTPDMANFSTAVLNSSLTHIDLMVRVLKTDYFRGVMYHQDLRTMSQYLLTAAPAIALDQVNANFMRKMQSNPKGMAAQILGMDPNHLFLQISSNSQEVQTSPPHVSPFFAEVAQIATPVADPIRMMGPYMWTGNIADLFSPEELALDLAELDEWVVTDLDNPVDLDAVVPVGGYQVVANQAEEDAEDEYNFADSF